MTYPVVASFNGVSGTDIGASGTVVPQPSGVVAGDLLIAWCACDSTTTAVAASAGWTVVQQATGTANRTGIFARIATGGDALTVTGTSGQDFAATIIRVTGHGVSNIANHVRVGTAATGTSTTPDPPAITMPGMGDWLTIISTALDMTAASSAIGTVPTNYTLIENRASVTPTTTTSVALATAWYNLQTYGPISFIDPIAWGTGTSGAWVTQTISIAPATSIHYDECKDNYLFPMTGNASVPDIAIPPGDVCWVVKMRGPNAGQNVGSTCIIGQWEVSGQFSYRLMRSINTSSDQMIVSANGTSGGARVVSNPPSNVSGQPQYWAWTYPAATASCLFYTSTDQGATYSLLNTGTSAANALFFDSNSVIRIGFAGALSSPINVWSDRIYWAEMRTGTNPKGGTLLWRFDANEYSSGTTFTDARGKVWTLSAGGAITAPTPTVSATVTFTCTDVKNDETNRVIGGAPYLSPAIARATTPDPGYITQPFHYVVKLRGPATTASSDKFFASQGVGSGTYAYDFVRRGTTGAVGLLGAYLSNNGTTRTLVSATPTVLREPQCLAVTFDDNGSSSLVTAYTSPDEGQSWVFSNSSVTTRATPLFDSSDVVRIGGSANDSSINRWDDRIYWIEMRTGLTIGAGTLLWRFDAAEWTGRNVTTTLVDPRGRTWTLSSAGGVVSSVDVVFTVTDTVPIKYNETGLAVTAAATVTSTASAHYKEVGGGAPASPYLFTEDWNVADDTHWDWAKWPIQRPYYTISGSKGIVTPSGGPSVASSDKYVTDFEMTVKVEWQTANPNYPEICWRLYDGLGGYSASSGYVAQVAPAGRVDLYKVGAYSSIGNFTDASLNAAGVRWWKVRVVGTSHKVKWWNDGSAEPGTWQIDATDSSPQTDTQGAPIVGGAIGFRSYGSPPTIVDDLTVVDLASPPLPVTDGSMRMLSNGKAIALNGNSNAFPSDTDLSWCGWVRYEGRCAISTDVWSLFSGGSTYCSTSVAPDGSIRQYMDTGDFSAGYTVPLNTWVFLAMSRSITGGTDLYWAPQGTSTLSTVHNASKGTITGLKLRVLSGEYGSNPYSMGCAFKCWTAALTKTELEAEMTTYAVQRTANLFLHYSMRNGMFYAPDNDPLNDQKWIWWEQGAIVSGPVATHLLDAPAAPSGGGAGLATSIAATITSTDVYTVGRTSYNETGRQVTAAATVTSSDLLHRKEIGLPLPVVATTTITERAHYRNATYFRTPSLLSYDFADTGTTVTDRSGNGRNGTLTGATQTAGQLVLGGPGQLLSYTPNAGALPQYASVTLKFTTSASQFNEFNLWSKMRISNSSNFNMYVEGAQLSAVVRGTTVVGPSIIAAGTGNLGYPLAALTTYQAALTYDGTTTRLYVNGVQFTTANTASGPLDMTGSDTTWSIGDTPLDTTTILFSENVYVDDVRFFDYALTAAEVAYAAITPVIVGLTDLSITATATVTNTDVAHRRELALATTAAATVTSTDLLHYKELTLAVVAAATVTSTDLLHRKELTLSIAAAATVTSTDVVKRGDLTLAVTAAATVTSTDLLHRKELALAVITVAATVATPTEKAKLREPVAALTVAAEITSTDVIHVLNRIDESGRLVTAAATVTSTDVYTIGRYSYDETGRAIVVSSTVASTDKAAWRETGLANAVASSVVITNTNKASWKDTTLSVAIAATYATVVDRVGTPRQDLVVTATATFSVTEKASRRDLGLATTVAATVSSTDRQWFRDAALTTTIAATVTSTDKAKRPELALATAATATVATVTDRAHFRDTLALTVTVFVASTDLHLAPGHFDETQRAVFATATVTTVVDQTDYDQLALTTTAAATVTSTDAAKRRELGLTTTIAATVTCTDARVFHYAEPTTITAAVTITSADRASYRDPSLNVVAFALATTTLSERSSYKQLGLLVSALVTITNTDAAKRIESPSILSAATIGEADRADYNQLALPVSSVVTTISIDALATIALFAITIAATIDSDDVKSKTGVVVLNEADALYLGDEAVDAVYVGDVRVWP